MIQTIVMLVIFALLAAFWFYVCVAISTIIPRPRLATTARGVVRIRVAAQVVAALLCLDSTYWLLTNGAYYEVFPFHWHAHLRAPWVIAAIKATCLVSAVLFVALMKRVARTFEKDYEGQMFERIVDLTWDAVGVLDDTGNVIYWNHGAETLFGHRRTEVIGKHIRDFLVPEPRWNEIDEALNEIRTTRTAKQNYRTERRCADGSLVTVDITISPMFDGHSFRGYFGIMRRSDLAMTPR
jgi:PAS domain S-box-containing protein